MPAVKTPPTREQLENTYESAVVDIDRIFVDEEKFNCRAELSFTDVESLAESIRDGGLQCPPCLQPKEDVEGGVPEGFDWRCISGHRRLKALRLLRWTSTPATIRRGLSEMEALAFNLIENIERKQLNLLEEAKALEKMVGRGAGREKIAKMIKKSAGWVQCRFSLLDLPEEIQQAAAVGVITQHQIKELYTHRDNQESLFQAFRQIKEAKERGEKAPPVSKVKPNVLKTGDNKAKRMYPELAAMLEHFQRTIGNGLHTRVLAWATGVISDMDLHADAKVYADENALPYYLPGQEPVNQNLAPQIREQLGL